MIETANKVFVRKGFPLFKRFTKILIDSFHSSIQDIDFGDSKAASDEINGWVEDKTKDKIKDLIKPNIIKIDTSLVLVNAIYFKSNWVKKFDKTKMRKFQISPSSSVEVPMMMKSDTVFTARLDILSSTMVELPYKGDRIVMQILLPETKNSLEDLEDKLRNVEIHDMFEKEKIKTKVEINLPKFKQESTLPLKEDLKKLDLKNMFNAGKANFSGITDRNRLYVSHVVQKAIIEVDEKGTEAAAGTAAVTTTRSRGPMFIADHPFIFYLRDKESGMLLFQGKVTNPLKNDDGNNNNHIIAAESESLNEVKSVSLSNDKFSTKLYDLLRKSIKTWSSLPSVSL